MADNRFEYFDELGKSVVEMGTSTLLYKNKDGKIIFLSKDESRKMLEKVTKAGEYEAKVKAFDNLVDVAYWHFERIHSDGDNVLQYESFYKDIRDEFRKYESGESE